MSEEGKDGRNERKNGGWTKDMENKQINIVTS